MQRLGILAISILIVVLVALPSTTSSQNPRSQGPQGPRGQQQKFVKKQNVIPNRYIVVLNDDVVDNDSPREARLERVTEIANSHALAHNGRRDYVYETALKGYAIELPNEAAAVAISRRPEVQWVEEEQFLEPDQTQVSPQPTPPWGLDVIDGTYPLAVAPFPNGRTNGIYQFNGTGTDVNAYVIDTGINTAHADFGTPPFVSRAIQAADCIRNVDCRTGPASGFTDAFCQQGGPNPTNNDCHQHGTHVAATLGGNTYGVAKAVNIRSLKVCVTDFFSASAAICPSSAIIAAVNWVTNQHQTSSAIPKVVNISLGVANNACCPPFNDPSGLHNAVVAAIGSGVTVVTSAGNSDRDARFTAPKSVTAALVVGAVDWAGNRMFAGLPRSNFGPGVDLWAPGVDVLSAKTGLAGAPGTDCATWDNTNFDECRDSGTSMAAPHVAGSVALYMQGRNGLGNCVFPIEGMNGPTIPLNANLSTCPDRIHRYFQANAQRDRLNSSINGILRDPNTDEIIRDANGNPIPVLSPNLLLWNIAVPTLPNPMENHRFFVWSQYRDFLSRDPDSGGFNTWVPQLFTCAGTDWPCINAKRIHIVRGFIESAEFKANFPNLANPPSTALYNEEYVRQLYRRLLRRDPDPSGFATWVGHLNSTSDGYSHVVHGFINSAEYRVRFGPQ